MRLSCRGGGAHLPRVALKLHDKFGLDDTEGALYHHVAARLTERAVADGRAAAREPPS